MAEVHRTTGMPDASDPLAELLRTATSDMSTLFRQELALAKVEVKEDAKEAGKVGAMFGVGAVAGHMALLFVSLAIAWAIGEVIPRALGFLIVGVVYGIVAAVMIKRGKEQAKRLSPPAQQTVETLKEDVQWAKQQTN